MFDTLITYSPITYLILHIRNDRNKTSIIQVKYKYNNKTASTIVQEVIIQSIHIKSPISITDPRKTHFNDHDNAQNPKTQKLNQPKQAKRFPIVTCLTKFYQIRCTQKEKIKINTCNYIEPNLKLNLPNIIHNHRLASLDFRQQFTQMGFLNVLNMCVKMHKYTT